MKTPKIEEVIEYSDWIVEQQADRVKEQKLMRDVYDLLPGTETDIAREPGNEWMIAVVDSAPHDSIRTMTNILSNREPRIKIKIPREAVEQSYWDRTSAFMVAAYRKLPEWTKRIAYPSTPIEKMQEVYENVTRYTFKQNDDRRDGTLRKEAALDGFIYDQIALKCVDLRLTKLWKGEEYSRGQSPFVVVRLDPTSVYGEWNDNGISSVLHRYIRTIREVKSTYGDNIKGDLDALKDEKNNVLFCEKWWEENGTFWKSAWIEKIADSAISTEDRIERIAWIIDGEKNEIQENTLGFIPIVVKTCNGTGNAIMPTLYSYVQSGHHQAASMQKTIRASLVLKTANPQFQLEGWDGSSPTPNIDYRKSKVMGVRIGQKISLLDEPHNTEVKELGAELEHQSQMSIGISETMMGRYPTGAPASAFNLSAKMGSQIVEPVREALNKAFSQVAQMEWKYLKSYEDFDKKNAKVTLWMGGGQTVIDSARIPEWMDVKVDFIADLPQDEIALTRLGMETWNSGFYPWKKALEVARAEDVNEFVRLLKEERGTDKNIPRSAQMAQPSAQELAPNAAQGYPVDQNPQAPDENMMMQNRAQNPMMGIK